jgi:hypothetical protein
LPNWCSNHASIEHKDPAAIQRIEDAFNGKGLFQEFLPINVGDGPDVAIAHWGTKWDVNSEDGDADRVSPTQIILNFNTAWKEPDGFYRALVEQEYDVEASYFEPGMAFAGEFKNGSEAVYEGDPLTFPDDIRETFGIDEMHEEGDEEDA